MIYRSLHDLSIQPQVSRLLLQSIEHNRLHHAYLLYGAEGSGKLATALAFAAHILCTESTAQPCQTCPSCIKLSKLAHPDLTFMFPAPIKDSKADPKALEIGRVHAASDPFSAPPIDGNLNYYVESMRDIKADVKYAPTEAQKRIILLQDIEKMNDATANAFLKLLEEPPEHTMMIMTSSNIEGVLPTIKSRCQKLYAAPLTETSLQSIASAVRGEAAPNDLPIKIAGGNAKRMLALYESDIPALRGQMLNFLRYSIVMKPVQIATVVESFAKCSRLDVTEFLNMLEFWFRDAELLLRGQEQPHIFINVDLKDELNKFTSRYPNLDTLAVLGMIEDAKTKIRQNVHIGMTLTALAVSIHDVIVSK